MSPPLRSEPSALVIESAKAVSRRLRTTEHNHHRSGECTRHPGRLGTPKGTETNRRAGSSLPDHLLPSGEVTGRSQRAQPRPTQPNGDLDASIEVASSHGLAGSSSALARAGVATVAGSRLRSRVSDGLDRTRPWNSGDDHSCSASYRLDTSTPLAVARRRRRLAAEAMVPSPPIRSPETPSCCGVRLELRRDVTATT